MVLVGDPDLGPNAKPCLSGWADNATSVSGQIILSYLYLLVQGFSRRDVVRERISPSQFSS